MRTWGTLVLFLLALGLSGCSSDDDSSSDSGTDTSDSGTSTDSGTTTDSGTPAVEVTYYTDAKPIIDASCAGCHMPGGAGVFDMTSYQAAKPWASAMALATHSLEMPPWAAFDTEDCTHRFGWKNDQRLTDEQIATLQAWADGGALEGDPADDSSEPAIQNPGLSEWDFEGSAATPVEVTPGGDDFVCIVIDPGLEEETWLQGAEFIPDNVELVHHVVLFSDPTRASLDLVGDDGTYPCFGGAGVPGSVAAAWAPGVPPLDLPDDMATRIAPGTLFVMQMHYSPQGGAADLSDKTTLRFRYADASPQYEVYTQLMGNLEFVLHPGLGLVSEEDNGESPFFMIPADATEHRETSRWTYAGRLPGSGAGGVDGTGDIKLMSILPHMHYAGVEMKAWVDRPPVGGTACEPNMLVGLLTCANDAECVGRDDFFDCTKAACGEQWDAMSIPCWGCVQQSLVAAEESGDALTELLKCEVTIIPEPATEQPARECLLSAPKYNFEWQRFYEYDVPIEELPSFTPGTVLTMECTYDNTMSNPLIAGALTRIGQDEPSDIELGDETLDEMCLVALLFTFERED